MYYNLINTIWWLAKEAMFHRVHTDETTSKYERE